MYKTPSQLSEAARADLVTSLDGRLADGLDLHMQIKVAHWNVRGPQFPALHPLFEQFALELATFNDSIAERAVTLGGLAAGTSKHVAKTSRLPDYPLDTTKDLEHVKLLAERFDIYLAGVRETRALAQKHADEESIGLLTDVITAFEKNAWFLRATLA